MGFLQKAGRDVETMPGTEKTFALKEMCPPVREGAAVAHKDS